MAFKGNSITIFDLDDTLVVTNARIEVRDSLTGEVFHLTPQEFNDYEHQPHHEINYGQFEDPEILKAGKLIDRILSILKSTYENETAVGIITARNRGDMIREFFLENGIDIHPKFVIAVNDPAEGFNGSVAQKKQQAFRRLYEMGYTKFRFFDDDIRNLTLAKELESELPISVDIHHVTEEESWAVPASSFSQETDYNAQPMPIGYQMGGIPTHWTTSQPYSRWDLKTNPWADRYGMNPKSKPVKSFDEFFAKDSADHTKVKSDDGLSLINSGLINNKKRKSNEE